MTRDEHLAWCKHRALEYFDAGDWIEALNSMVSDLLKHPATCQYDATRFGFGLVEASSDTESVRKFIEEFT